MSTQYSITHPDACWAHVTCSQEQYQREVEGGYSLDTPGCRPDQPVVGVRFGYWLEAAEARGHYGAVLRSRQCTRQREQQRRHNKALTPRYMSHIPHGQHKKDASVHNSRKYNINGTISREYNKLV